MRQPGITAHWNGYHRLGEDGVDEVEYKVWIVDFLRQPGQIGVGWGRGWVGGRWLGTWVMAGMRRSRLL